MSSSTSGSAPWTQRINRADPASGLNSRSIDETAIVGDEDTRLYHSDDLLYQSLDVRGDGRGNEELVEVPRAVKLGTAVERFTEWAENSVSAVVSDGEQCVAAGDPHRFAPRYRRRQYARLMALARGVADDYGKLLNTAMLSLTASSTPNGRPVPIVDHQQELLSSYEAVRRSLYRELTEKRGLEWEYIGILEPHKSGYAHLHIAVFVKGPVDESAFEPAVDAHLDNCKWAGQKAHADSVEVYRTGVSRQYSAESLGAYLATYLGESFVEDSPDELEHEFDGDRVPHHVLRFWAGLWASGAQQIRPSNGAQEYMKGDYVEDDGDGRDWEFVGIVEGVQNGSVDAEDVTECDPPGGGRLKRSLRDLRREGESAWASRCRQRRRAGSSGGSVR